MRSLLKDARIAPMRPRARASHEGAELGAVLVEGERIAWVGPAQEARRFDGQVDEVLDCGGRLLTPGLIDCHTHLVFGGDRVREFEQRLEGQSYAEIAQRGGGIVATVQATRRASEAELLASALGRVDALVAEGVTTIEVKSGYGLDLETELKCLRVARALASERRIRVRTTFLGAHALPPGFAGDKDAYIDEICSRWLPVVAQSGLADHVDAFAEHIAFSTSQVRRLFEAASRLGFALRLHAEQLSDSGAAVMAAEFGAQSVDHLEYLPADAAGKLAAAGTVAVLLPGAFYCLQETQRPPVAALREAGVPIALATDLNPGSSPLYSLLGAMNMGCVLFGLTPREAMEGVTCHAATALGLEDELGSIEVGKQADLALWNESEVAGLSYRMGHNACAARIFGGNVEIRDPNLDGVWRPV